MKKQLEQISHNIPRVVALQSWPAPGASRPKSVLPLEPSRFPIWARKRLYTTDISDDKENLALNLIHRPLRSRWTENPTTDVYTTLLDTLNLAPITSFTKLEVNIPVFKKLEPCTPGVMDFSIDQSNTSVCDTTIQEDDVIDEPNDDTFVSVEDSMPDFLMEDFESLQSKLPPPKNPSRLSLSAQFHEGIVPKMAKKPSTRKVEHTHIAEPETNSAVAPADAASERRAIWEQNVERSRQRLIELGLFIAPKEPVAGTPAVPAPLANLTTPLEERHEQEKPDVPEEDTGVTQLQDHEHEEQDEPEQDGEEEVEASYHSDEEHNEPEETFVSHLDANVTEIDCYIQQFKGMFDQTLSLYWNLADISSRQPADAQQEALEKLEALFFHMRSSIEEIIPSPTPHPPQMDLLLQLYSDKLVDMVKDKLDSTAPNGGL